MIRMMKEMARTMETMDEFHRRLLREATIPNRGQADSPKDGLLGHRPTEKAGETFSMTLAAPGFSADELTVKLVGRKLLVTGAKEIKTDDGQGSFYKYEVFRRESDLPESVSLEGLTCAFSSDGQLHVEAPRLALPAGTERNVPIQLITASDSQSQEGSKENQKTDGQEEIIMDQCKTEGQAPENCKTGASGQGSTDPTKTSGQRVEEHSPLFARVMDKERESQTVGQ